MSPSASSAKEAEIRANSRQHYDMCVQAANHITLIGESCLNAPCDRTI